MCCNIICYLNGGVYVNGVWKYDENQELNKQRVSEEISALDDVDYMQLCYLVEPDVRMILKKCRGVDMLKTEQFRDMYWMFGCVK